MTVYVRGFRIIVILTLAGVMGLGFGQIGSATSAAALSAGSTSTDAALPDGDALFRQSFSAMARSMHAVHSEMTVMEDTHQLHAREQVSGDCVMDVTSHSGQVWERGTRLSFRVDFVNRHFIEIGPIGGPSRTWRRTPHTGNRWRVGAQPGHEEDTAVLFFTACPLSGAFAVRQTDRPRFQNLGPARIRGFETWHLHLDNPTRDQPKAVYGSSELYVERGTLRWIRASSVNHSPDYRRLTDVEYSRFNESVTITAPSVGSSNP